MPASAARCHKARMLDPFAPDPDALTDHEREQARWHPDRETLELAAAGAATVLGARHRSTLAMVAAALAKARVALCRALSTLAAPVAASSATSCSGRQRTASRSRYAMTTLLKSTARSAPFISFASTVFHAPGSSIVM